MPRKKPRTGSAELERLEWMIRDAFVDVAYPGDDHIALRGYGPDEVATNRIFRQRTWQDLIEAKAHQIHDDSQDYLTPEAFHYFLPAFLIIAIKNPKFAPYAPYLKYSFSLNHGLAPHVKRNLALLDHAQITAILRYFKFEVERGHEDPADDEFLRDAIATLHGQMEELTDE